MNENIVSAAEDDSIASYIMLSSASNFTLAFTGSLTTAWDALYGPELVWSLSGIMQCGLTHVASESNIQGAILAVIIND